MRDVLRLLKHEHRELREAFRHIPDILKGNNYNRFRQMVLMHERSERKDIARHLRELVKTDPRQRKFQRLFNREKRLVLIGIEAFYAQYPSPKKDKQFELEFSLMILSLRKIMLLEETLLFETLPGQSDQGPRD